MISALAGILLAVLPAQLPDLPPPVAAVTQAPDEVSAPSLPPDVAQPRHESPAEAVQPRAKAVQLSPHGPPDLPPPGVVTPRAATPRLTRRQISLPPSKLRPRLDKLPEIKPIALPTSPNDIYYGVNMALADIPANRHYESRFISLWPYPLEEEENIDDALRYWTASMSTRRVVTPPRHVPGLGWYVYLSDYNWDYSAWEALVHDDPYFAVTRRAHSGSNYSDQYVDRGWLDPELEYRVRHLTGSSRAVIRADRFLGRTGTEVGGGGFYSLFLRLPNTETQLFKNFGIDERFLKDNALLRGGAVLGGHSIVALNNRELQLLPSPLGLDARFVWRSLDMDSNLNKKNVLQNFLGTVQFTGKEFIGSNLNGTHWYYLANKDNKQVSEVPTKIAQDKDDPHDVTVFTPYKCVKCHGPKDGIRHFDDAISRIAMNKNVGLAVITQDHYRNDQLREALEDYYMSPLAKDITNHQVSYRQVIKELNGLDPGANADNFVRLVEGYLFGLVTTKQAAVELGVEPEQIEDYLKQTGNEALLTLLSGEGLRRELFEQAFADGMRARIYPWERSLRHEQIKKEFEDPGTGHAKPPVHLVDPQYGDRTHRTFR